MTPSTLSTKVAHDLWLEARKFKINISRPTPTTVQLQVVRPVNVQVTDGFIVLLSTKPINAYNYPSDSEQYTAISDFGEVPNTANSIGDARVVGAFYDLQNSQIPDEIFTTVSGESVTEGLNTEYKSTYITVQNTDASAVYYASVHAASNVLQYYPLGVQSYPLDGSQQGVASSTLAGNIPSFPEAPTSPVPGMVYHDIQLNSIQYYDSTSGTWIPTRSDTIKSGSYNPGILGQTYLLLSHSQLKVFNDREWVTADPNNFSVRVPISINGSGWHQIGNVAANIRLPDLQNVGDFTYDYTVQRIQYWDGIEWVYPTSANTLFSTGNGIIPAFTTAFTTETLELPNPYLGQLFYNTSTRQLNAWNGQAWQQANTDQQGTHSTAKINIGTDGSYDERIDLAKILQAQLGWPQMCIELSEEQFNYAIDNALDTYRQLSSGAYKQQYILLSLIKDQQKYFLNSPVDKTDHVVQIDKIHRISALGPGLTTDNIFMQAFLQDYYYSARNADLLSTHLVQSLSEDFGRLFANDLLFNWDEHTRELFITRRISYNEKVLLECVMERTEQELLVDRYCRQFLQNWALAELKMYLGLIRSKFSSGLPGPSGNITLNGELLIAEARQDQTELKQGLLDYEYGGIGGMGNCSFIFG